jgi:hypothetical protein
MDRLREEGDYEDGPPDEASARAAVDALQAELELADGNLDALDRKTALLPAFLAALAGLFISSDAVLSGGALAAVVIALGAGILSVSFALYGMRARAHILGPDVDEVIANLDLPIADFNAALAGSLAEAINRATLVALFKARWLNRAMILAVATILFLSFARLAGGPQ